MNKTSNKKINKKNIFILFAAAIAIRLIVFFTFIQKNEYYKQPDSNDYNCAALTVGYGYGMVRPDCGRPTFWRTPGYALFLAPFYRAFNAKSFAFSDNWKPQTAAILLQIILGALITLLIFLLAMLLTNSLCISWATAIISALHPGFVLSDLYILTETLSIIFLIPFFIFFFKSFYLKDENSFTKKNWLKNIIFSAIFLGIFTWVRPMGQFVSVVSAMLILIFDSSTFKIKLKKILIFLLIFFSIISPWYIRNYNITGKIFFCPMIGLYLNTFNAPKIIRATEGLPLMDSINKLYARANNLALQEYLQAKANGLDIATEIIHGKVAIPVIMAHPFLFIKDWTKEVAKTTFDLYSYQLVTMARGTFYADPIEEFLTEKWQECLYKQKVPLLTRIIIYLEILFEILKWLGLIFGFFLFWIYPIIKRFKVSDYIKQTGLLWLKVSPFILAFVGMTGGFGYARLRLPIESLMIILSLTFWCWLINRRKQK